MKISKYSDPETENNDCDLRNAVIPQLDTNKIVIMNITEMKYWEKQFLNSNAPRNTSPNAN